jgi:hypothetical protein
MPVKFVSWKVADKGPNRDLMILDDPHNATTFGISVATHTLSETFIAAFAVRTTSGIPQTSRNTLPGHRVDASRAGIMINALIF